mgnify:CR=1 FL=1|tara:strand:+ start:1226 stop:2800 length:1575 start_codon:yes stop_codon:yes gene_type:complete
MIKILSWINKKKKSSIRAYIRGYNKLLKEGNPEYIDQLKKKLSHTTLDNKKFDIFSLNPEEVCLQQFLIYRTLNTSFNTEILKSLNKETTLNLTIPYSWRLLLEEEGFKANTLKNHLNWKLFQFKWLFYSVYEGLSFFFKSFREKLIDDNYVYFHDLSSKNFPGSSKSLSSYNLINWFINSGNLKVTRHIAHSAEINIKNISTTKISKINSPLPPLKGFSKLYFLIWLFAQTIYGLVNQKECLILREKIMVKIFDFANKKNLPSSYYFHNSWAIFKPLWTYKAEQFGIEVVLYFYSTNILTLTTRGKNEESYFNPWLFSRWKEMLVWNKSQEHYINMKTSIKPSIFKVGPIPFYSDNHTLDIKQVDDKPKILIFDVQPPKTSLFASLAPNINFYNSTNTKQFLNDIDLIAKKIDAQVYIKRKRNTSIVANDYLYFLSKLKKNRGWIEIDADINAFSLTETIKPDLSINFPFTSTAYITDSFAVPTVYYDPKKILVKTKYDYVDIELINTYEELKKWVIKTCNLS